MSDDRSTSEVSAKTVAVGVPATYDAVAGAYDRQLHDELDHKPLDRALLTAFLELAGAGRIADVGCGPGHVTRFVARTHTDVVGIDLSPAMIAIARQRGPELTFHVGSMLALPAPDAAWSGVLALYSIIHLTADERAQALSEFGRVLRPGGWLLVAFHVDSAEYAVGQTSHLKEWFGISVDLEAHFLSPNELVSELQACGFTVTAKVERQPLPGVEYPSRRCYLLAQRQ